MTQTQQPQKAKIWYANPYIPWHDPEIPGGKLGEELTINSDGKCQLQTLISNGAKKKVLKAKPTEHLQMPADDAVDFLNQILHVLNYIAPKKSSSPSLKQTTIWFDDNKIIFNDYKDDDNLILYKLSLAIRKSLNRADLMVFDGNSHDDFIDKIIIKYVDTNYQEKITLNSKKETITYWRKTPEMKVSTTYSFKNQISRLLDELNPTDFTSTIPGLPDNAYPDDGKLGHFECVITCHSLSPIKISGDYQQYSLPTIWNPLIESIYNLINVPVMGAIVDQHYYKRYRRCKDDLIYLSVSFTYSHDQRKYNYLTDDDSIMVGDWVWVPVGPDNRKQRVLVIDKNYYKRNNVPYPLNKIKRVIGKAEED